MNVPRRIRCWTPAAIGSPRLVARLAAVAAALLCSACGEARDRGREVEGAARPPVPEEERYGGTLVAAGRIDVQTMNSLISNDFESGQFQAHVLFVTLVRNDARFEPQPYLASGWEFSTDSTELLVHLRDDVRWHDGEPVTARDVAFTFDRIKDPRVPFLNPSYFDSWEEIEVLDDHTLRFHLRPTALLLYGWTRTAIMPAHILGRVPPGELAAHPFGTVSPIGSGPFRFVERIPGDRWVFEANPEFPEELGGRPYLERLVYRQIPDEATVSAALRAGEVDLAIDAGPATLTRLADDSTVIRVTYHAPDYNFIAWNSKRAPFREAAVRRALTMAIDRQAMVRALRGGYGTVAAGPVGPWHWAHDTAWRPLPYAPDSAARLLDAAGWTDSNGDRWRDREGVPFRFELLSTPRREWEDIAAIVQASLARVGIDVRPRTREQSALMPRVTGPQRRFDAVLVGWARDVPLDDRDLWACDQLGQPAQFTSYCNARLDPILDSIRTTPDRERLRSLIRRYQQIIAEDQPYTFLYYLDRVDLHRSWVRGVEMDARGDWVGVTRWWIDPGRRRGGAEGAR